MRLATQTSNRRFALEQLLCGNAPDSKNQFRSDQSYLSFQEPTAGSRLVGVRVTISRRSTLQDIGDEYGIPVKANRGEYLVQQFSCSTNKGLTLPVLFGSRRLTDDHPVSTRVANPENRLRPARVQCAGRALRNR